MTRRSIATALRVENNELRSKLAEVALERDGVIEHNLSLVGRLGRLIGPNEIANAAEARKVGMKRVTFSVPVELIEECAGVVEIPAPERIALQTELLANSPTIKQMFEEGVATMGVAESWIGNGECQSCGAVLECPRCE
jgi:GTP-sensing pleiotropic transcriptional regulator CodY